MLARWRAGRVHHAQDQNGEIELAIAVDICEHDADRTGRGGVVCGRRERSAAAVDEDADIAVHIVRDGDIELAIAVDIAGGDGGGFGAGGRVEKRLRARWGYAQAS
jgi:hypothetical protein